MKIRNSSKQYICVGENFVFGCDIGFCGDVHTLAEWIEELYPNRKNDALDFFDGDSEHEVLEYLYRNKGKRLESLGKK